MKSRELLNDVMEELEVTEALNVSGGYTPQQLACIIQAFTGGCSWGWVSFKPATATTGGYVCTHR